MTPIGRRVILLAVSLMLTTCVALAQTYQPGTYVGGAQGFGGEVEVQIEVDEESMGSIDWASEPAGRS